MPDEQVLEKPKRKYTRRAVSPQMMQAASLSGFDPNVFAALIAKGVVEGMAAAEREKTAAADAIKLKNRKRMQAQLAETRAADILKWKNCSHMRGHPYSGTSRIAWATQSDGVTRGTCMGCGAPFSPIASELPDPSMTEWYKRMIAVPQTIAANDFLTGTVMAGSPA
jgi:hypothetical protein